MSKALELANDLRAFSWPDDSVADKAADEIERLHEVNAELLKALKMAEQWMVEARKSANLPVNMTLYKARSAIAKAEQKD